MRGKGLLKGTLLLAGLGVAVWLIESGQWLDRAWIDAAVRGQGARGVAVFFLLGAVFTGIGAPRQVLAFLGGYAFGFGLGTLWSTLATLLGCALSFYYARSLARGPIARRFSGRVQRFDTFLARHPFSMILLIRLLPVGSNLVTNLLAGVSSVRTLPFLAGSGVGFIPQNLAFALAGAGSGLGGLGQTGLAIALLIISGAIGIYLYKHVRHPPAPDTHIAEALDESLGKAFDKSS